MGVGHSFKNNITRLEYCVLQFAKLLLGIFVDVCMIKSTYLKSINKNFINSLCFIG